jgi:hypothetical protein
MRAGGREAGFVSLKENVDEQGVNNVTPSFFLTVIRIPSLNGNLAFAVHHRTFEHDGIDWAVRCLVVRLATSLGFVKQVTYLL